MIFQFPGYSVLFKHIYFTKDKYVYIQLSEILKLTF